MIDDFRSWDEMEETGLRLCPESSSPDAPLPTEVTACSWDPNSPGEMGICGPDGSFVLVRQEEDSPTAASSYAVYFNTLPVQLWGRRGGPDALNFPHVAPAPARRVEHAWSQLAFVPGHPGEVLFVQGCSPRVLLTTVPKVGAVSRWEALPRLLQTAAVGRFGLLDGSRVVALDGHQAQVQCLAVDAQGRLLLTGDESGAICARLLCDARDNSTGVDHGCTLRSQALEGEGRARVCAGGGSAKVLQGAHEGGVLAMSHVGGGVGGSAEDIERSSMLFVSGGIGGVVRLWRATARGGPAINMDNSRGVLEVELLADMLVGGCQVSCLAGSLTYQVPLLLAGTAEGTVFAFSIPESTALGARDGGSRDGRRVSRASELDAGVGKKELGAVLMKFEHTTASIESISCSREQELIAVADADGFVRTYRPLSSPDGAPLDDITDRIAPGVIASAGRATGRPFELIVECCLGARPASCEFAFEDATASDEASRWHEGEVLRTCARDGSLRAWPVASLPMHPIRSPPEDPLPRAQPPPNVLGNSANTTGLARASATGNNEENVDPACPSGGRGVRNENQQAVMGDDGGATGAAKAGEEELTARREAPLPGPRPAAPRRVSFAPKEEVYKLQHPYYESSQWTHRHDQDDEDDELEAPRPPPPAPTPAPPSSRPRRLRQTWGRSPSTRGGRRGSMNTTSDGGGDESGVFVTPSRLQEPSLWSTAVEQAALERRIKEEFDEGAVPEPSEPAYRAAAAVVNIHPLTKMFEGLVPVSLDAPLPRPKRKGKQVSKAHLSKVEERRITEDDLVFEDMEPSFNPITELKTSGVWSHQELEWYGGQPLRFKDTSMASDRVWSWGLRP